MFCSHPLRIAGDTSYYFFELFLKKLVGFDIKAVDSSSSGSSSSDTFSRSSDSSYPLKSEDSQ